MGAVSLWKLNVVPLTRRDTLWDRDGEGILGWICWGNGEEGGLESKQPAASVIYV